MTILERRQRRQVRRQFLTASSARYTTTTTSRFRSASRATPTTTTLNISALSQPQQQQQPPTTMNRLFQKLQRHYQKRRVVVTGSSQQQPYTKLLVMDRITCAVLKLEIQQLLLVYQNNNNDTSSSFNEEKKTTTSTLTPLTMVNALLGSRHLLNVYAEGNDDDDDDFVVGSTHSTPLVVRRWGGRRQADSSTQRRYDFMNTLHQLQQYCAVSSHSSSNYYNNNNAIAHWDDAVKILSMVFHLPPEYVDDNNNNDQNNHHHITTTTTTAVLAIPDSVETVPTTTTWTHHPSVVDDTTRTEMFLQRLRDIRIEELSPPGLRPSQLQWLQIVTATAGPSPDDDNKAPPPLLPLFRDSTDTERVIITTTMTQGSDTDIVARTIDDTDSVQRRNLRTLEPYEWVNDEVIHFYLYLLQQRDEQQSSSSGSVPKKRTHFFKSFFMTKLLDEGNSNPALDGVYNYNNVKRWSKKVPGKDIFNLSKIVFPINQGNQHWTSAVIYMEEQRIQYYDSLGGSGKRYLQVLLQYLQDEHQDKKKTPMKCPELWTLVPCTDDTPRQQNGYDCGVFTCFFADFLSANRSFEGFQPSDMSLYRQHIALSIIKGEIVS